MTNIASISAGKNWLEKPKPFQKKKSPSKFPELLKAPKPIFIDEESAIPTPNPNPTQTVP